MTSPLRTRFRPLLAVGLVGLLAACDSGSPDPFAPLNAASRFERGAVSAATPPRRMPDFALLDVNPNSPRHDQAVSPRDEVGKISAWYFGHAT